MVPKRAQKVTPFLTTFLVILYAAGTGILPSKMVHENGSKRPFFLTPFETGFRKSRETPNILREHLPKKHPFWGYFGGNLAVPFLHRNNGRPDNAHINVGIAPTNNIPYAIVPFWHGIIRVRRNRVSWTNETSRKWPFVTIRSRHHTSCRRNNPPIPNTVPLLYL